MKKSPLISNHPNTVTNTDYCKILQPLRQEVLFLYSTPIISYFFAIFRSTILDRHNLFSPKYSVSNNWALSII